MYKVTGWQHRKAYIKGDVEAEDVMICSECFSTRTQANQYLVDREKEAVRMGYTTKIKLYKRGNEKSELFIDTGYTWIHENTGDTHRGTIWYVVEKF